MIRAVAQYAKVMQTQVLDKKTTMFFSEDGIKSFLETGRVDEYPKECYSPLDFDERIALIRRFLALRDRANLRMIRETKERAEHALNISVNANEGYLLFQTHPGTEHSYGILRLPGIHETGRTLHGRGDAGTCRSHSV